MLTRRIASASAALVLTQAALAQTDATYLLVSTNTVSPSTPTTTIEVWTAWVDPAAEFAFLGSNYDLTAGEGVFANPVNVLNGPGSGTGLIVGNTIAGAANGQITGVFPPSLYWSPDNPILLATYDWTTTEFTPRTVNLHTSNTLTFTVGLFTNGASTQLYPQEFTPGTGVINVVPAPGAALLIGLPLAWARRRRRC